MRGDSIAVKGNEYRTQMRTSSIINCHFFPYTSNNVDFSYTRLVNCTIGKQGCSSGLYADRIIASNCAFRTAFSHYDYSASFSNCSFAFNYPPVKLRLNAKDHKTYITDSTSGNWDTPPSGLDWAIELVPQQLGTNKASSIAYVIPVFVESGVAKTINVKFQNDTSIIGPYDKKTIWLDYYDPSRLYTTFNQDFGTTSKTTWSQMTLTFTPTITGTAEIFVCWSMHDYGKNLILDPDIS
jgi:hypothetical protein